LTGVLLHSQELSKAPDNRAVFVCPEESHFYSHCLERLVFNQCDSSDLIIEFGSGDGSPVINSLLRTRFNGVIHGYEFNTLAYETAQSVIRHFNLDYHYVIYNQSFFDSQRPKANYLIANPPYLPAPDNNIRIPLLHGGFDGATITNQLLSLNYSNVMLLTSSYSNPVNTIKYALAQGYGISDFMITPLKFGQYSSETKVKNCITELRQQGKAFFSKDVYFLAGVLFRQSCSASSDLSAELIKAITSL
jgi:methylase of polypeptide subunit release factors